MGGGDREGESGRGQLLREMGRGAIGMGRVWQWGGGQREEEMERGATGRRERGNRWGWGGGEEGARLKRRGDFTDGYDGMPGWT